MKQARRAAFVCIALVAIAAAEVLLCQEPPAGSSASPARQHAIQQGKARPLSADEQSCKAFVQNFYDWDWNWFFAHMDEPNAAGFKIPKMNEIIRHRPQLLSAQLQRLLMADAALKARNADSIAGLEIDPFLNDGNGDGANVPYIVQNVTVDGQRCEATFNRRWPEWGVRPELEKTGTGWIFVNFHYSFYNEDGTAKELPDDDLVHMLSSE